MRKPSIALLAALFATPAIAGPSAPPRKLAALSSHRNTVEAHYALELDHVAAGWLLGTTGGHAAADVGAGAGKKGGARQNHAGSIKYEDITLVFGTGMSKALYQWIKDSFDAKPTRKNGAIIATDYDHKEISRLEFSNALITEVGLPALDAGSKDAAKMTIKISPEVVRTKASPGGQSIPGAYPTTSLPQKKWLLNGFKLVIDDSNLAPGYTHTSKIEALTLKQKVTQTKAGEKRDYSKTSGSLQLPNLVITLPESHAQGFYQWHQQSVINGTSGKGKQKNGTLQYLAPDLNTVLFTLKFGNLGIFKVTPDKVESHKGGIRRVKVEMYVEKISFDYKAAWQ